MFAEAASSHEAARAQLASARFSELGDQLRSLSPRLVVTCARGSSDHAATFAKYLIETRGGPMTASFAPSIASLYGATPDLRGAVCLVISQSGASPDLIASTQAAKRAGAFVLALLNSDSPIAAVADAVLPLGAGEERSVAATKTFLASLFAVAGVVSHWLADTTLSDALPAIPDLMAQSWELDWSAARPALTDARSLFTIGRGLGMAAAGEAALKLKESCAIHAEAYSAAEARHGPLAIIRPGFPALLFAQRDAAGETVVQIAAELAAFGAAAYIVGADAEGAVRLPSLVAHPALEPLLAIQSFYRLAHDTALARGYNPDRPHHLSKVTETL
jgi:glucosamine--fructose-6-phosphate aminotransferase (isomerizing)